MELGHGSDTKLVYMDVNLNLTVGSSLSVMSTASVKVLEGGSEKKGAGVDSGDFVGAIIQALSNAMGNKRNISWEKDCFGGLTVSAGEREAYIQDSSDLIVVANTVLVLITSD